MPGKEFRAQWPERSEHFNVGGDPRAAAVLLRVSEVRPEPVWKLFFERMAER